MDPADYLALQSRLTALADCLAKGADKWDRMRLSDDVLDMFRWGLVSEIPALQEVWAAARKAHYAAVVDIFSADSAEVLLPLLCCRPHSLPLSPNLLAPTCTGPLPRSCTSPLTPLWSSPLTPLCSSPLMPLCSSLLPPS